MDLAIKLHFDLRSTPLLKNPLLPFPSPPFLTIRASLKPSKSNPNPNLNLTHVSSKLSALAVDSPERATSTSSALDDVESLFSDSNLTEYGSKKNSKRSNAGASSVSSGVRLENVSKTYKDVTVLRDVSWEVKKGEKVGLVGVNGAGKTTQLRIITGLEEPDTGNVVKAKENMKISFLSQEFEVSTSRTVKEEFLSAFKEEMEISAKLEKVQKAIEASVDDLDLMGRLLDEFDNLQRKAQAVDLDLVEAKVSKLMPELGFSPEDSDRLVASFSGGWQMRMCLGKILLQDPDLLLLDEPTNHLDLDTIEWLEEYLGRQDVPMVIISHDRAFLDQLCTKIVETDMGVSRTFNGNYSDYVISKAAWIEAQYAAWEKQQKEIEHTRDIISRLGAGANSGRASTAEKKLEKLQDEEQIEKPFIRKQMKIRFPERGMSGKSVVTISNLQFGYGDNMLFRQADVTIQRGEKVAIIGPNGCGKSTLLKLIMGFEKPVSGEVILGEHNVLPNYFEQNQAEALDLDKTVLEAVAEVAEDWRIDDIKGLLGRCNFKADMLDRKVSLLSGGEKVLKEFAEDIVPLLIPQKNGDIQAIRIVLTSSNDDKTLFEKELKELEEQEKRSIRGFREVIDLISASEKPVVAHNTLDDFTFIHSKFLGPLPATLYDFKQSLDSFFPHIIDLNHLIKEVNPQNTLSNIPAALAYMRNRFFAPVNIEIPHEGLSTDANEVKVHGHNVLQVSQLFAKLSYVLEQGTSKQPGKDDNLCSGSSHSHEDFPNEDVWVSSGKHKTPRKLSSEDLVFLWGFSNGHMSAGELQRLLVGSHEALSNEDLFDVKLVDKSCAVVAFWRLGSARAFVESMVSGGFGSEKLKEMVSQGLRAADYEGYKTVCRTGLWESDLADSLDKADDCTNSEADALTNAFEIYWENDDLINLDDL